MIEVSKLVHPDMLVEMDADKVITYYDVSRNKVKRLTGAREPTKSV